jgi:hypothetical protein
VSVCASVAFMAGDTAGERCKDRSRSHGAAIPMAPPIANGRRTLRRQRAVASPPSAAAKVT